MLFFVFCLIILPTSKKDFFSWFPSKPEGRKQEADLCLLFTS